MGGTKKLKNFWGKPLPRKFLKITTRHFQTKNCQKLSGKALTPEHFWVFSPSPSSRPTPFSAPYLKIKPRFLPPPLMSAPQHRKPRHCLCITL